MIWSLASGVFCAKKTLQSCRRSLNTKITHDNFFFQTFFYGHFQKSFCGVNNDTPLVRRKSSNYTLMGQKYEKNGKFVLFSKFSYKPFPTRFFGWPFVIEKYYCLFGYLQFFDRRVAIFFCHNFFCNGEILNFPVWDNEKMMF